MKNKKGDFSGLVYMIVFIAAFAIFLLIIGYITPQITTQLKSQIGTSTLINNSLDSSTNVAAKTLPTIWLSTFVILFFGLLVTSFLVQTHPIFVPIFVILLVLAIVVSVPLSNSYQALATGATLSGAATEQGMIGMVMGNLPMVTFILGLIIMIVTFAKPGGRETLA